MPFLQVFYFCALRGEEFDIDFGANFHNASYQNINEPVITCKEDYREICIPIKLKQKTLFVWHFVTKIIFSEEELHSIRFHVELLVLYESLEHDLYPSFMVFLHPFSGSLQKINKKIKNMRENSFIFLNGQTGTGKFSFFQCFLLLHYNFFVKKPNSDSLVYQFQIYAKGQSKTIFFIPEMAMLDKEQQRLLLLRNDNKDYLIFALSVYEVEILIENDILHRRLADVCNLNRIALPSLSKRGIDIVSTMGFVSSIKLRAENIQKHTIDDLYKMILKEKYSLNDLYQTIYDERSLTHDQNNTYDNRENHTMFNLRDKVAKIEKEAIRYAHSKVGSSQHKMSDFLGISRGSLQNKLKKYRIEYDDWFD